MNQDTKASLTMIDAVNMKPLVDRQREAEEKVRKALTAKGEDGDEAYKAVAQTLSGDIQKWKTLGAILGREVFDELWGVYRDTVEQKVDKLLTKIEGRKQSGPSIFGGA